VLLGGMLNVRLRGVTGGDSVMFDFVLECCDVDERDASKSGSDAPSGKANLRVGGVSFSSSRSVGGGPDIVEVDRMQENRCEIIRAFFTRSDNITDLNNIV